MRHFLVRTSASIGLLSAISTIGCDANPGLYGALGAASTGTVNELPTTLSTRDNVIALGTHVPFAESWRYTMLPDPTRPETTEELVWADSNASQSGQLVEIQASQPIFAREMAKASWTFTLPSGGTSSVYTTTFSSTTVPWIDYPTNCQTLSDPACAQFQHRPPPNSALPYSFPYLVGDISLPAGQQVRIDTVAKTGVQSAPGARFSTGSFVMETGYYQMDPNVVVVPVHVHVFVNSRGNLGTGFLGGLTNSEQGRIDMAAKVRNVFDAHVTHVLGIATATDTSQWHREYRTRLTRNPIDVAALALVFDELLLPCNVQVQLGSVDYIGQSFGLETAEIGFGNARQNTPWWDASNPKMQADAVTMTNFIRAVNNVAGVHVFVVGTVNPGSFSSFETSGIGWTQAGTTPGYALISGTSAESSTAARANHALSHEVGHVLGLQHDDPMDGDEIDQMFLQALSPRACSRMLSTARGLLTPAANH